jgi:hypothetical protein
MAQGLGFIEFSTGDVLSAAAANGYLASQTVMVFASAAARTSAIATPYEGMISYLKDTNAVEYYSGSAWVAVGAAGGGGMTLLSTTTLSGAGTTISSISGSYTDLQIYITGVNAATNGCYLECNLNGVTNLTDANYFAPTSTGSGKTFDNASAIPYELTFNSPMLNGNTDNSFNLSVLNYASTTSYKAMTSSSSWITSGTTRRFENGSGYFVSNTAVTSIQFRMHASGTTTNFSGGTVLIYGVK